MKKVAIVQRQVTHYRVQFYNLLGKILKMNNIELTIFAGDINKKESFKDGLSNVKYAKRVKNYNIGKKIYWQNIYHILGNYDLVIMEQSNSAILNFQMIYRRFFLKSKTKIAFWGHGSVLHEKDNFISKKIRTYLTNKVDFWFAYTELTREILYNLGVSKHKISIVNNSIDVSYVIDERNKKSKKNQKHKTVVFCSRLYKNKALPFVINGCEIARNTIPNLRLIIIGDGPEKKQIINLVKNKPWITMKGSLYDKEKAKNLLKGDIMVLPSHVGLSILDGFAAGLPIVISDFKNHCPEITYFTNNVNGLLSKKDINDFAKKIAFLFENPNILSSMSVEAIKTAEKYSVNKMAKNFANGIIKSLSNS